MAEVWAGAAAIAFPAEVVARQRTCAVSDSRFVDSVDLVVIRSEAPLVEHLLKPTTLTLTHQSFNLKYKVSECVWFNVPLDT